MSAECNVPVLNYGQRATKHLIVLFFQMDGCQIDEFECLVELSGNSIDELKWRTLDQRVKYRKIGQLL